MWFAQPKWLKFVSIVLVLWGALLALASYRTARLARELPRMSCDDFLRVGRPRPEFLILTDVRLCRSGDAFWRDMDAGIHMYVPVYSARLEKEPRGPDLKLLLEVLDERERDRLLQQPDVGELYVELWTQSSSLDPWVQTRLSEVYPGIQLAKCRVLSVGLHEPSLFRAAHEWRDGILILALAAVCQMTWWTYRFTSARFRHAEPALSESTAV